MNRTLENGEIAAVIKEAGDEEGGAAAVATNLADVEDESGPRPKRMPLPHHLEPNETELAPPTDGCRSCGVAMRMIGEDVADELERRPPLAHAGMRCRAVGQVRVNAVLSFPKSGEVKIPTFCSR